MIGKDIYNLGKQLWPINRSLTGQGVRDTLLIISKTIPNLKIKSIKSGTKVFDWTIPKEWAVVEAYIITPRGKKICNFSENNLYLLGYSVPFKGKVNLTELKKHLYTIPEQPNAIPYVTSYYEERWGFCLTQNMFDRLEEGIYEIVIDTKLFEGVLNFGELLIKGNSEKEIFLSTNICHPSMANNELSGPIVVTYLAKWLEDIKVKNYSYRIVFLPETIGSISYLSENFTLMKKNMIAGYNISCIGDDRSYSFIPSRNGTTISDRIAKHVLKWTDSNYMEYSWLDRRSDERQYCSPGIDLPVASILRTKYGSYPEYHTSLDVFDNVVTAEGLNGGYWSIRKALEAIDKNKKYNIVVPCEPQLSKYGLYPTLSRKENYEQVKLMMDFISFCDGKTFLLDIANKLNVPMWNLYDLVENLKKHKIIIEQD